MADEVFQKNVLGEKLEACSVIQLPAGLGTVVAIQMKLIMVFIRFVLV